MVIINLKDIIVFTILIVILLVYIFIEIIKSIGNKFKKNCFKCKYYELDDVAGFGDRCWYRCKKKNKKNAHSMNDKEHFEKCDYFTQI